MPAVKEEKKEEKKKEEKSLDVSKCSCKFTDDDKSTKVFIGESCDVLVANPACKGKIENGKCVCQKG